MPEPGDRILVTNTTPLIALTAATGGLDVLRFLYDRVVVPLEVAHAAVTHAAPREILARLAVLEDEIRVGMKTLGELLA